MTEYEVNDQFAKDLAVVLSDTGFREFNAIREQELKVLAVICTRTKANGEYIEPKGIAITCKRVPPVYQLLTNAHYLVVCDYYFWTHAPDREKTAALHHALSAISVERTKKGVIKLKTRKPEIQVFRSTLTRFGAWNAPLVDAEEALKISAKAFAESRKPQA
jgi:hypothetical protein